ncbi:nicotinamidase/pyrazinamidase [Legionella gratiana]|uniref:nicotinamidase n=1 Tax=Legionella gratiana TaxID=45066 RepID=A0A378JG98_9GAMM|nr:bifunctional nicotinamidase/pyrazinamidase [Legionella gratiana]KTD10903.1 nicotinamidase/pyrazinamidase [Legionella gratiana]STX45877.1 nicotinamidase/pyrazinamidase [Legionella gratiana]
MKKINKTLIITDVQNDFMPGGPLAVLHGDSIIPIINQVLPKFDLIVATQDWHPQNHKSFASNHPGKKPFDNIMLHGVEQILWPNHCIQGTFGAELHPMLEIKPIEAIFRKGMNPEVDSYSVFYDNQHQINTGLVDYLHGKGAKELYFCGLCADICVYFSIKDALHEGFKCYLIDDATMPLNQNSFKKIKAELIHSGVTLLKSNDILP